MHFAIFAVSLAACMTALVSAVPVSVLASAPVQAIDTPVARSPIACRLLRMCI
ncbi:hypothetical protein EST38_g1773 [Candolleomyces aberdarensis]|uniref:Uncharacterized protein n=1 Tax=Candolleomyces aberdarensis TaxID=2316362 RepID=A0A4Q2DV76_9AGAR|nr:hypothetical protein EST38_g1773 [Candolleomyces aberdarensis]